MSGSNKIIRWIRGIAGRSSADAPNCNNNATQEFNLQMLSRDGDPDFILEERSRLLIQTGDYEAAISILETTSETQGRHLMLGECYFETGRFTEGLHCSVKLMEILTSKPRPRGRDLMNLTNAYLTTSYNFRALLLLRCAAKIFALEAASGEDEITCLTEIENCSYECFCLIDIMIEHDGNRHTVAKEFGVEFMLEMLDLFRDVRTSRCGVRAELEARLLNNLALCCRAAKNVNKAVKYLRTGIAILKNDNCDSISYNETLGSLLRNIGLILHHQGDPSAQTYYLQSLDAFGKSEKLRKEMKHSK